MCPRFRAYHSWPRKNRRIDRPVSSLPGDIRRGTDLSAARFYGHTPRKLPVFTAISRIIADCALTGALIFYNTVPCVSRIFSKNFYTFFTGPGLGNLGTIPCIPGFCLPQAPQAGKEGRGPAPPSTLYIMCALTGAQARCPPAPAAVRPTHHKVSKYNPLCDTTRR